MQANSATAQWWHHVLRHWLASLASLASTSLWRAKWRASNATRASSVTFRWHHLPPRLKHVGCVLRTASRTRRVRCNARCVLLVSTVTARWGHRYRRRQRAVRAVRATISTARGRWNASLATQVSTVIPKRLLWLARGLAQRATLGNTRISLARQTVPIATQITLRAVHGFTRMA